MGLGFPKGFEAVEQNFIGSQDVIEPHLWAEKFGDYLLRFAKSRVSRVEVAEDLVQETFLAAWKGWKNFQRRCSLKTWLITILKNKIIDHYEKTSRESEVYAPSPTNTETQEYDTAEIQFVEALHSAPTPETVLEQRDLLQKLIQKIESFPDKMRRSFLARVFDETSAERICNELKITESNLWVLIYRARSQLKLCMTEA